MVNICRISEGDAVYIPLQNGRMYSLGVIARGTSKTVLLGYLFAPRPIKPTLQDAELLIPSDVYFICRFFATPFKLGRWEVLGKISKFSKRLWKNPKFLRYSPGIGMRAIGYMEDNPLLKVSERRAKKAELDSLFEDSIRGDLSIEDDLDQLET